MSAPAPILAARAIVKRFAGITALKGVGFELFPGEVHALCGENGAGKSTLIKLLGGVHAYGSYEGEIDLAGQRCRFGSTRDAERAGIALIHQELALLPEMSVAENLCLGALPRRMGLIDWAEVHARARRVLEAAGVELDPAAKVGALGVGQRQLVEIARAVGKESRVLVLDEPTAALTDHEVERLLALVRALRARGVACIYISHKLDEVLGIADRITVLRDGESVATFDAKQTDQRALIRAMVGREIDELFPRRRSRPGEVKLRVRDLTLAPARGRPALLTGIDFELRAGEVLGIGGLLGAGRSELLMHLYGAFGERLAGEVEVLGKPIARIDPRRALRAGLALVSEDRRRYGLFPEAGARFNLSLSSLSRVRRGPLIDAHAEQVASDGMLRDVAASPRAASLPASALSGGNQQKLVLARALLTRPEVLLLDEPTRGVDVGAKREIYELINRLTDEGKAIVLVSSELAELLAMSDRILMMCRGRIAGEFTAAGATQQMLLAAAFGYAPLAEPIRES